MFDKESKKDIQSLDVAKLTNIRRNMTRLTNLLFYLSKMHPLTVRTREHEIGLRWSRHPTNTFTGIFISFLFI
jgi:hypothetical protein